MAAGDENNDDGSEAEHPRTCFVVSAFGSTPEEQRRHEQALRHLICKALQSTYTVVRADEIDDEGLITNQIIEHLVKDDLVVADLTGLNPNVFYEVAVRHAAGKPIVHLIAKGQEIPFDIANMRAVVYALDDPDILEKAQEDLRKKVAAIEDSDFKAAVNPVTAAVDVLRLRESDEPAARDTADILAALQELRDDVRNLGRRVESDEVSEPRRTRVKHREVLESLRANQPATSSAIADDLGITETLARKVLVKLSDYAGVVELENDRWIASE